MNTNDSVVTHSIEHLGARFHVEDVGEGSPVLLLHGGLGHLGTVAGLRTALAHNHRVVAFDSRGMGRSTLGDTALSYRQHEDDALAVLAALGVEHFSVVGVSDGGITGYRLASRGDGRVHALVTLGSRWRAEHSRHLWEAFPAIDRDTLAHGPFAQIVADYERLNPEPDFDRLGRLYDPMWRDNGPDGHPGDQTLGIEIPTLILVGDRDDIVPVAPCIELHGHLANSQLMVVPGAGHAAHLDRPELVERVILEFSRETTDATRSQIST